LLGGFTVSANAQEKLRTFSTLSYMDSLRNTFKDSETADQDNQRTPEATVNINKYAQIQAKVIPVIFHLFYQQSESELSPSRVQEQLDALNRDFGLASVIDHHPNDPNGSYASLAIDTEIQFCVPLAIEGLYYYKSDGSILDDYDLMKQQAPPIQPEQYLNIWVSELIEGDIGFAQMPTGENWQSDGIVINSHYFGVTGATAPYNEGKTLTHLVGNYLGLFPLWGASSCWDDYVLDTPISNMQNTGCPTGNHISTCDGFPNEMTMNFMDGTDDACKYMFTKGQAYRMHAMLEEDAPRGSLGIALTQCESENFMPLVANKLLSNNTLSNNEEYISVYPNPAIDYFNLTINNLTDQPTNVTITTIDGRSINSQTLIPLKATTNLIFPTAQWKSGIYLITVTSGEEQYTQKIAIE